jgi:hypothetical protein
MYRRRVLCTLYGAVSKLFCRNGSIDGGQGEQGHKVTLRAAGAPYPPLEVRKVTLRTAGGPFPMALVMKLPASKSLPYVSPHINNR